MKILFYSDALQFGGHEVTMLEAVVVASKKSNVKTCLAYNKKNHFLVKKISEMQIISDSCDLLPHEFNSESGDILRTIFCKNKVNEQRKWFNNIAADVVVVCQGHIGSSVCALLAAKRSSSKLISFIPMAHTASEMYGLNLTSAIVDIYLSMVYQWPDQFLTVSNAVSDDISNRCHIEKNKIFVVPFGPRLEDLEIKTKEIARNVLGLGEGYWVGLVGRIDFNQKGHNFLIKSLKDILSTHKDINVLVVGDGPDKNRLIKIVEKQKLTGIVKFVPWVSNLSSVYGAIDVLVMPSRYEGVPIVMMEAMYLNVPILASNINGIREFLPDDWLFRPKSKDELMKALARIRKMNFNEILQVNRKYIRHERNNCSYRNGIERWLTHLVDAC